MAPTEEVKNQLISLYVGYFNRAPDPKGLDYWIKQLDDYYIDSFFNLRFRPQPDPMGLNYQFGQVNKRNLLPPVNTKTKSGKKRRGRNWPEADAHR